MSFVAKTHLSRRTFLNGVGVALAVPFLESMVPALARGQALTAALPRTRLGCIYFPHGAIMPKWTPGDRRRRIRADRDPATAQAVPRPDQCDQRPGVRARVRKRRDREPQPLRRGLPERRIREDRRTASAQYHGRPACGSEDGTGHPTPFARADDRGIEPQLRRRPELRRTGTRLRGRDRTRRSRCRTIPQVVFERLFGDGTTAELRKARRQQSISLLDSVMAGCDRAAAQAAERRSRAHGSVLD